MEVESNIETYTVGNSISVNPFCLIRQCVGRNSGLSYVMKSYVKQYIGNQIKLQQIQEEVRVLKELDHPCVVKLVDFFEDAVFYYLILESIPGKCLQAVIDSYSLIERQVKEIFYELIQTVMSIHDMGISIGNLTLESVYWHQKKIILTDFSDAWHFKENGPKTPTYHANVNFCAPEAIGSNQYSSPIADIWSLGVILFTLFTNHYPWRGVQDLDYLHNVISKPLVRESTIPLSCFNLIERMLKFTPANRYSLMQTINHYWMTRTNDKTAILCTSLPQFDNERSKSSILRVPANTSRTICPRQLQLANINKIVNLKGMHASSHACYGTHARLLRDHIISKQ